MVKRYFLSRALAAPFMAEHNHLCNFDRGHYGEHFCGIILNLDKMSFKDISHLELWLPLFGGVEPFVQFW